MSAASSTLALCTRTPVRVPSTRTPDPRRQPDRQDVKGHSETHALRDQCEDDEAGGGDRQVDADSARHLGPSRATRTKETPVFRGEDLCAYGGRCGFSTVLHVKFDRAARCRFLGMFGPPVGVLHYLHASLDPHVTKGGIAKEP